MTRLHGIQLPLLAWLLFLCATNFGAKLPSSTSGFSLWETNVVIRQVSTDGFIFRDASGYPKIDWQKFQSEKPGIVERQHKAVIMENRHLRLTLLPEMGRVYSLISKANSHEQLWINQIAKPIPALNDTGWWMIWGGIEYTIPRGEHGTTWALPWSYQIIESGGRRKAVRMKVLEPVTRLEETLEISIFPDRSYYEAEISIANTSESPVRFAHWINPMWAPGGRGEITPETELIVPCTAMVVLDRDFNRWMLGHKVQEYERNPLRYVKHWRDIGDLLAQEITDGFYGAFSHDANEGVVRIFDPKITPGLDIWTWGFPPPPTRQREYSEVPNLGYVEMWGGTARDFSDDARGTLAPRTTKKWKEWMYALHNTHGFTYANRDLAVNFKHDDEHGFVELGLFSTRDTSDLKIIVEAGSATWLDRKIYLSPAWPFYLRISTPENHGTPRASQTCPQTRLQDACVAPSQANSAVTVELSLLTRSCPHECSVRSTRICSRF